MKNIAENKKETKEDNKGIIVGRNPVMEALKSNREIEKLLVSATGEGSVKKIIAMASDKKIPIHYSDKNALDRWANGTNHQGVVAFVSTVANADIEDMIALAKSRGKIH